MNASQEMFTRYSSDPEFHFELLVNQVGTTVARRMAELRISRSALARRLDTSPAWVTQLLRGDENLTLKTLGKLAVALEFEWSVTDLAQEAAQDHLSDFRVLAVAA